MSKRARWKGKAGVRLLLACFILLAFALAAMPAHAGDNESATGVSKREPVTIDETGPDTPCEEDSDCWCAVFTGAEFLPERVPYFCCKERSWNCPEVGRCPVCYYE